MLSNVALFLVGSSTLAHPEEPLVFVSRWVWEGAKQTAAMALSQAVCATINSYAFNLRLRRSRPLQGKPRLLHKLSCMHLFLMGLENTTTLSNVGGAFQVHPYGCTWNHIFKQSLPTASTQAPTACLAAPSTEHSQKHCATEVSEKFPKLLSPASGRRHKR